MFRWIQRLPFWGAISLTFWVSYMSFLLGALALAIGLVSRDVSYIIAGGISMMPFLFYLFLLWATYRSDGYDRPQEPAKGFWEEDRL